MLIPETSEIRVVFDIKAGEEITICYIGGRVTKVVEFHGVLGKIQYIFLNLCSVTNSGRTLQEQAALKVEIVI